MALTLNAALTEAFERSNVEPLIYARIDLSSQAISWAGSVSSGDTSVTLTTGNTTALEVGMEVRHANIPANTTIQSITDSTHFELTLEATGTISSAALTIVRILALSTGPSDELDGEQVIESVTSISQKLDPYSRKLKTGELNLKCLDDGTIRYHNGTYPLKGRSIRIWLTSPELTLLEAASFFVGVINEITPVEGAIEIQCKNFLELLDAATFEGSYYSKHPLVVIKQLLEHGGVSSDYIDTNSFNPSHADHAAIEHYTVTSISLENSPWQRIVSGRVIEDPETFGLRWRGTTLGGGNYPGPKKPVSVLKLIHELVFYLSGMIWIAEDGKIYFKSFDKTEAVVAHLTTDDYAEFKQVTAHEHIANDFLLDIGPPGEDKTIRVRDTAAITSCGTWPKSEKANITTNQMQIVNNTTSFLTTTDASVSAGDALAGFIHLQGLQVTGCTGTQGTTYSSGFSFGGGSAAGHITSSYPIILEFRGELIKGTTIAMQSTPVAYAPNVADDGTFQVTDYDGTDYIHMTPTLGAVKVTAGVRGLNSTTPRQMTPSEWWYNALVGMPLFPNDITMIYDWITNYAIPRFSHGLATVEITTPLSQFKIEVGDLISIDNDVFLWRNNDGLSSTSKLEVIGKEVDPFSDNPRIKFTLAMANPANAPTNTISFTLPTTEVTGSGGGGLIAGGDFTHVGAATSTDGLTLSDGGSLNTLVAAGAAGQGIASTRWDRGIALAGLTASKENHITVEPRTGVFNVYAQTAGTEDPPMVPSELHLGVATTDGSSLTAFTDERALGGITGKQLDRRSIEAGRNMITDGTFQGWPGGGNAPVRGWELAVGTWGTDAKQSRAQKHSGRCSILMPNTAVISTIDSDYVAVVPGELYSLSYWARVGSTSLTIKGYIRYYDAGKTYLSQSGAIGATVGAVDTWEQFSGLHTAPATAAFARVRLLRFASVSEVYFDDVTLGLGTVAFGARLTADASSLSTGDVVPFAGEDYDRGSNFDTGAKKFTAPNQGFYKFASTMVIGASSNAKDVTVLIKKDSASSVSTLKQLNIEDIVTGDSGFTSVSIQAGAVLKAGDVVWVALTFSAGQPVIEGTATSATSFTGELVR